MTADPKVSVCVVVYNQEHFIGKCLESLVGQSTMFPYEILVGDDCSTDDSRSIISRYAKAYPGIVKPLFHERNLGPQLNLLMVHRLACGKYIAHIDGDDYALPGKLQKQSDYLDANPGCSAVVHRLANVDQQGTFLKTNWPDKFSCEMYDLERLVLKHPEFGHSSLMYRQGAYDHLFSLSQNEKILDFHIYIHLASLGLIGVINETLGVYRCGVGISTKYNFVNLVVDALNKARKLGLKEVVFREAASRQIYSFSTRALAEGELDLFRNLVAESYSLKVMNMEHFILFKLRNIPIALRALLALNNIRKGVKKRILSLNFFK